jgi:hypothetical protein
MLLASLKWGYLGKWMNVQREKRGEGGQSNLENRKNLVTVYIFIIDSFHNTFACTFTLTHIKCIMK